MQKSEVENKTTGSITKRVLLSVRMLPSGIIVLQKIQSSIQASSNSAPVKSAPVKLVLIKSEMELKLEIKEILLEMNDSERGKEIIDKISHTSQFSEIDFEKDIVPIEKLLEMIN